MPLSWLWIVLKPYWRYGAAALVTLALVAGCHVRDTHLIAQGKAEQRASDDTARAIINGRLHTADSMRSVLSTELILAQMHVAHDTTRLTRWLAKTDTVEAWRTDTITVNGVESFPVPVATVQATDSTKAACKDLAFDCAAFQKLAAKRFATDSGTIADLRTHPVVIRTSCTEKAWVAGLIGAAAGGVAGAIIHR